MAVESIPFSQHIPHFPDTIYQEPVSGNDVVFHEAKPDFRLLALSAMSREQGVPIELADESVRASLSFIARGTNQTLRSAERAALRQQVADFCNDQNNFATFSNLAELQVQLFQTSGDHDEMRQAYALKDLAQRVDEALIPPSHIRFHIHFAQHVIVTPEEYDMKRAELLDTMVSVFQKGEQNILVKEGADKDDTGKELIQRGLKLFGSLRAANAYTLFIEEAGREPTTRELVENVRRLDAFSRSDAPLSDLKHNIMVGNAFDTLLQDGYPIELVYEESNATGMDVMSELVACNSVEALKEWFTRLRVDGLQRDKRLADQLSDLYKQVKQRKGRTNALILVGVNHTPLETQLSVPVSRATTSSKGMVITYTPFDEINRRIVAGEEIENTLWQDAFTTLQRMRPNASQ